MIVTLCMQDDARAVFSAWATFNSKQYSSTEEADRRFSVWSANVQRQVERQGQATAGQQMEINGLADLSREEFKAAYLGHVPQSNGELLRWVAPPASSLLNLHGISYIEFL